jgi:hypothetical protein
LDALYGRATASGAIQAAAAELGQIATWD